MVTRHVVVIVVVFPGVSYLVLGSTCSYHIYRTTYVPSTTVVRLAMRGVDINSCSVYDAYWSVSGDGAYIRGTSSGCVWVSCFRRLLPSPARLLEIVLENKPSSRSTQHQRK